MLAKPFRGRSQRSPRPWRATASVRRCPEMFSRKRTSASVVSPMLVSGYPAYRAVHSPSRRKRTPRCRAKAPAVASSVSRQGRWRGSRWQRRPYPWPWCESPLWSGHQRPKVRTSRGHGRVQLLGERRRKPLLAKNPHSTSAIAATHVEVLRVGVVHHNRRCALLRFELELLARA